LQQAIRRQRPATAIDSKLPAMGKDERALSVSSYVYRESVKYTDYAFDKTTIHKRKSRNDLVEQIESFRIGDKDNKREDDLLDTLCYGIAIGLGNSEGFRKIDKGRQGNRRAWRYQMKMKKCRSCPSI
jgi:hypothetical protein